MRDNRTKTEGSVEAGHLAEAGRLTKRVKAAIDAGSLNTAELFLAEAQQALGTPATQAEHEIALTLSLERATIIQYRGEFDHAYELAEAAVRAADEQFGPRGIHISRARLRRNFALEAKREFKKALRANLELADELVRVPGSDGLRLNCLTRSIACSVKNAERAQLQVIGLQADSIWTKLNKSRYDAVSRWFLYWCAIASLRQGLIDEAEDLLGYADKLGERHWRWDNAADFARGHGMTLNAATRQDGLRMLKAARTDAEGRGFYGLIRSIDAGLRG